MSGGGKPVLGAHAQSQRGAPAGAGCAGSDDTGDALLVEAARRNAQAFGALYDRYVGSIYRYCLVHLHSTELAQDLTNEIFLKALLGLSGYRGGVFRAWLYRIAHNEVINTYRRRQSVLSLEAAAELPDTAPAPEEAAMFQEASHALQAALATLPEEQQAAVELGLAGWSGEEIAAALGKSADAVKMLRYRALVRLRAKLTACDRPSR